MMSTGPWNHTNYASLTDEERDALAAAADKAMIEGWEQLFADQPPLNPDTADLVEFVFSSMEPPEPPYGSAERALHDWANETHR